MRKIKMKLQAVILTVAMTMGAMFGNGNIPVMAADTNQTVKVKIQLTYGQTEARGMLEAVNTFRQGDEAWAWNEGDTEKITYSNLGALKIDPVLEQIAMLRAAEIALSYSHTRPNGQGCFTAYSTDLKGSIGENIAAGYPSAEAVFEGWQETEKNYAGQGHRRNMLSSNYVSIGIGHVTYQGIQYWVQEFSSISTGESLAEANDSTSVEELEVLTTNIQNVSLNKTEYSLTAGESKSIEELKIQAEINGFWTYSHLPKICTLENDYTITSANDQIAVVENGKLIAKSAGTTELTVNALGQEMQVSVTVTEATADPTEKPNPTGSTQPSTTKKPTGSTQPNMTEKPIGSTQPSTTKKPTGSTQPNMTEKPTGSTQPNMTEKPTGSTQPNETKNPSTSTQPSTTKKPVASGAPHSSNAPMETQKPDATDKPAVTQNPDKVKQPDASVVTDKEGKGESVKLENPLKGKKVSGIQVKQKKKSKKVTIRYKKMKKADGYQIIYAWNKKFTNHRKIKNTKSTSLTVSGLKRKKVYYFKVCAYTLDQNGKKQYSTDSKIVKCKMK